MSAVVYRAPDRELNLNESDKSCWETHMLSLQVYVFERQTEGETGWRGGRSLQSVNQDQKDGYDVFLGRVAKMIEGATIFLFLTSFFMTTAL